MKCFNYLYCKLNKSNLHTTGRHTVLQVFSKKQKKLFLNMKYF